MSRQHPSRATHPAAPNQRAATRDRPAANRLDRRTFLAHGARALGALGAAVVTHAAERLHRGLRRRAARGAARPGLPSGIRAVDPAQATPPASAAGSPGAPAELTVNGSFEPLGVDPDDVAFAWKLTDSRRGARQTAYRLKVATVSGPGLHRVMWRSGERPSSRQAFVRYDGPRLHSDAEYHVSVATRDSAGVWSPTASTRFVTGLRAGDWQAQWLRTGSSGVPEVYAYLRATVQTGASPIVRATAYVAAAHKYQLWANGRLADTGPAFSFPDESYYQATDLTDHFRAGVPNALGFLHHWYGPGSGRPTSLPALMAQITVHHADGTREVLGTGEAWRMRPAEWQPAPPRNNESGEFVEIIDARATPLGWSEAGYDDSAWKQPAILGPAGTAPFTGTYALRTHIVEHPVKPVSVRTHASGAVVADFGKVYAARPVVTFRRGLSGRTVPMHVGYLLDPHGHVSTTHGTQATDLSFTYIQRAGEQTFVPYTFLGFRYLEIDEPGEHLSPEQITAIARHAAMPAGNAAAFSSSEPGLDAVWELCTHSALYSAHEQFVDTPTRQKGQFVQDGTNESEAIMRAHSDQNMTWQALRDFARSQQRFWPDGRINDCYPDGHGAEDIPDLTELYPEWLWQYYVNTGDVDSLAAWYPVATNITDYIQRAVDPLTGLVTRLPGGGSDYRYGVVDWPPESRYGYDMGTAARTTMNVLAVNAFARVAQMATVLGDTGGADRQQARSAALRSAIYARLIDPRGVYIDGLEADGSQSTHASQQANALALAYSVVPIEHAATVAALVRSQGIALGPDHGLELLRGLHNAGLDAHIAGLLTDASIRGWARIIARGGTFTWEDWEPSDLDGDSMSHGWGSSALVAMQEALLGVTLEAPPPDSGTVTLQVTPPPGRLRRAEGTVPTIAGSARVRWQQTSRGLDLLLHVPPNAAARVHLPAPADAVTEGGTPVSRVPGIEMVSAQAASVTLQVVSGSYSLAAIIG